MWKWLWWLSLALLPAAAAAQTLAAAVLPASRSVAVGEWATVYATLINAGTAPAAECGIAPAAPFAGQFSFQTTDPATNVLTGSADTRVAIAAGAAQTFALLLRPDAPIDAELQFHFGCDGAVAPVVSGVNTLHLASSATAGPDMVSIAVTMAGDGVVHVDPGTTTGAFAVATANPGAGGVLEASVDTNGFSLRLVAQLCRTDPVSGACDEPAVPTTAPLAVPVAAGETMTFAVFVTAAEPIDFDPARHRLFLRFRDAAGVQRGATSVAVERPLSAYADWSLADASPQTVGLDPVAVDAVLGHVFTDAAVQGALLVKDGRVVGERLAPGYSALDHGTSWSVAKSFYAAALGAAIADGAVASLDQTVGTYVPEWRDGVRGTVTLRDVLQMRAGLPGDGNGCGNIYWETDQTTYAVSRPLVRLPATAFQYSNCTSQLLEPVLRAATGMDAHAYLANRLLAPIGIDPAAIGMWTDRTGNSPLTYCCLDMRLRDFARFGLLMARHGEWAGQQLLPRAFVAETLSAYNASAWYGLHWWILNRAYFGAPVPAELASAQGLDGQWIIVWPERDLVLVVLTRYAHTFANGFVLSYVNFPDTCTARNRCGVGPQVPSFDQFRLVHLIAAL